MFKKLLIILLIAAILTVACLPWWTSRLAEQAFAEPAAPMADNMLHKALRIKVFMLCYGDAGPLAERGVIYFPESPHYPFFLFIAAKCAEKEGNPAAAIRWYERFLAASPQHEWADQARLALEKIKAMEGWSQTSTPVATPLPPQPQPQSRPQPRPPAKL